MSNNFFFRQLLWLIGLYLVEISLASRLGSLSPPLVLLGVVGSALQSGPTAGFCWGLFSGLLLEPYSAGAVGTVAAAYALAGYGTGVVSSKLFGESFWMRLAWPCMILIGVSLLEALFGRPRGADISWWEAWYAAIPPGRFLSTLVIAPWVLTAMRQRSREARIRRIYR